MIELTEKQINQILNEATKQIESMSDSIKEQAAVASVKQVIKI